MSRLYILLIFICGCTPLICASERLSVDVYGKKLNFQIIKGEGPVVLLESGAGFGLNEWEKYAPTLAEETGATIVSYDREGKGKSDGLTAPYDVHNEMLRLHAGLYKLGLADKLVLVGHSYGGYLIQLYSNMYPEAVQGLVYVDVVTEKGIDAFGAEVLQNSVLKRNSVPEPDKKQKSNLRMGEGYIRTHETMRHYPVVCGVPVVVITAAKVSPKLDSKIVVGWKQGHLDIVKASGGKHIVAENSGHMVPWDESEVITNSVQYILSEITPETKAVTGQLEVSCGGGKPAN